jgi:hypothetical protein
LGEAFRQVSLLVSDGNITVFDELAWPFASFISTFKDDWDYDLGKLQAFLDDISCLDHSVREGKNT